MTRARSRLVLLACCLLASAASAETAADVLTSAPAKALGVPSVDGSGSATVAGKTFTFFQAGGEWVAVSTAAPADTTWLTGKLQATLSEPVLVIAGAGGSISVDAAPGAVKAALQKVAVNGAVAFQPGANFLGRLTPVAGGALASLHDLGMFPSDAVFTGTVSLDALNQLYGLHATGLTAGWAVSLTAALGAWNPKASPLGAGASSFTVQNAGTGANLGDSSVTFGFALSGISVQWPGAPNGRVTTSANALLRLTVTGADVSVSGEVTGVTLGSTSFSVKSVAFDYSKQGILQGAGLKLGLETRFGPGTAQRWTTKVTVNNTGTLAFAGTLDRSWAAPFGLKDFTLVGGGDDPTQITFDFEGGKLGFGVTGHLTAHAVDYQATFCVNVRPGLPPPIEAIGLSLNASQLDPSLELSLAGALVRSATALTPPANARNLDRAASDLQRLELPQINDASVTFYTQGLSCPQFAGKGFGGGLSGTVRFLDRDVSALNSSLQLNGGTDDHFEVTGGMPDVSLAGGAVSLRGAKLNVYAPLALSPAAMQAALQVKGQTALGGLNQDLAVNFTRGSAQFDFKASVQLLGSLKLSARSERDVQRDPYTLSLNAQLNPDLNRATARALSDLLLPLAANRKAELSQDVAKLNAAKTAEQAARTKVTQAFKDLPADFENALNDATYCVAKSDPAACLQLLHDVKKSEVYVNWLAAAADLTWAEGKYGASKASSDFWDAFEKGCKGTGPAAFSMTGVTVSGSLGAGTAGLSATLSYLVGGTKQQSTVSLELKVAKLDDKQSRQLLDDMEHAGRGDVAQPQVLWGKGAVTATALSLDTTKGKAILTARVASAVTEQCGDGGQQLTGNVGLYARKPDQPKSDLQSIPIVRGTVNDRGANCSHKDFVVFNDDDASCSGGEHDGCCTVPEPHQPSVSSLEGTWYLSAGYAGAPMACSGDSVDPKLNGFRESMSDEVLFGRLDDDGHPLNPGESKWGTWRTQVTCPPGSWATGFLQRVEPQQKGKDDTALNSVKLVCAGPDPKGVVKPFGTISSHDGLWGNWSAPKTCGAGHYLTQARIRLEAPQGGKKDDTAANDTSFKCDDNSELSAGNGTPWGTWTSFAACPEHSAICGIAVKLEDHLLGDGDDTAMNGMRLRCCRLP